jgi:hypothetical protein
VEAPKDASAPVSPTPAEPARPSFRITDEARAKDLAAEILRTTAPAKLEGPKARKQPSGGPRIRSASQQAWQRPAPEAPEARYALSYVGADELADEIWSDAINDLSIPPNERKDLIEDLNEDGFPDPHNVTLYDLPLILSRIRLIEEIAPDTIDEVNAEAFAEAYKDLMNMVERVVQQ